MQGEKTQPGKLFLHDLHVGYLMGIKFSINSDMEEIAHFLIFLKSHQMREPHMVLEKKKMEYSLRPTGHHGYCYTLSFQAHGDLQSHLAISLEASRVV